MATPTDPTSRSLCSTEELTASPASAGLPATVSDQPEGPAACAPAVPDSSAGPCAVSCGEHHAGDALVMTSMNSEQRAPLANANAALSDALNEPPLQSSDCQPEPLPSEAPLASLVLLPSPGPSALPAPETLRSPSPASDDELPSELASNFDAGASDFEVSSIDSREDQGSVPRPHDPFRSRSPSFLADVDQLVSHFHRSNLVGRRRRRSIAHAVLGAVSGAMGKTYFTRSRRSSPRALSPIESGSSQASSATSRASSPAGSAHGSNSWGEEKGGEEEEKLDAKESRGADGPDEDDALPLITGDRTSPDEAIVAAPSSHGQESRGAGGPEEEDALPHITGDRTSPDEVVIPEPTPQSTMNHGSPPADGGERFSFAPYRGHIIDLASDPSGNTLLCAEGYAYCINGMAELQLDGRAARQLVSNLFHASRGDVLNRGLLARSILTLAHVCLSSIARETQVVDGAFIAAEEVPQDEPWTIARGSRRHSSSSSSSCMEQPPSQYPTRRASIPPVILNRTVALASTGLTSRNPFAGLVNEEDSDDSEDEAESGEEGVDIHQLNSHAQDQWQEQFLAHQSELESGAEQAEQATLGSACDVGPSSAQKLDASSLEPELGSAQSMTELPATPKLDPDSSRTPLRSPSTETSDENAFLCGVECADTGHSSDSPSKIDVTCNTEQSSTDPLPAGRGASSAGTEQVVDSTLHVSHEQVVEPLPSAQLESQSKLAATETSQANDQRSSVLSAAPDGERRLSTLSIQALLFIIESKVESDGTCNLQPLDFHPFIIYCCSGRPREGQLSDYIDGTHSSFLSRDVSDALDVVRIEIIDPSTARGRDLSLEETEGLNSWRVTEALVRLAGHHRCMGCICTPPCRTFSCATLSGGSGPGPYRDIDNREGIRGPTGFLPTRVEGDNNIVVNCIAICKVCEAGGGFVLWENPTWRGKDSAHPIEGAEKHCSLWQYPPVEQFFSEIKAVFTIFDQCMTGQAAMKKTTLACSRDIAPLVEEYFGSLQCDHLFHAPLIGKAAGAGPYDEFRTSGAEAFTPHMNRLLGRVVMEFYCRIIPCIAIVDGSGRRMAEEHDVSRKSLVLGLEPDPSPISLGEAFMAFEASSVAAGAIQRAFRAYRIAHPMQHASQAFVVEWSQGPGFSVLVFDRLRDDGRVFVPGGKSEPYDTGHHVTLRRELYEETGFVAPFGSVTHVQDLFGSYKGRYTLHDYVLMVEPSQRELFINREPDKHSDLRWLSAKDVGRLPSSVTLDRLHPRLLAACSALPSDSLSRETFSAPVSSIYGFGLRLRLQRFADALRTRCADRRAARLNLALALQCLCRRRQAMAAIADLRALQAREAQVLAMRRAHAQRLICSAIWTYFGHAKSLRRLAAIRIQAAARGYLARVLYRYRTMLPPRLYAEVKRLKTCPKIIRNQRRAEIAAAVRRRQQLDAFDAAYAADFAASVASDRASSVPPAKREARSCTDSIDFSRSMGTSQFTEATFADGDSSFALPCSIHWDSCCGSAFLSPAVVDWLLAHHPGCVTVVSDEVRAATVNVVNASSSVIVERVVNLHGFHLSGVPLPMLENIRVIRGFRGGFLIGNPFHDQLSGSMDYRSRTYTFTGLDGERHSTPFSVRGSLLTSYYTESDIPDVAAAVAAVVKPIAFSPNTVTIDKRTEQVIECRVPSGVPVGSTILLTPLEASDVRSDIGVLVSHGLERVRPDGTVPVKIINPHHRKVTLPIMTPLVRFTVDPMIAQVEPEFDADSIMKQVNIGPEVTEEMRAQIAQMIEPRRKVVASVPGYAQGLKCTIDTPSVDLGQVSASSCKQPRWSPGQLGILKGVIDAQAKAGYVARTQSEWNSRPLLVAKLPTNEWRLVVDFRDVNALTVGDRFPLPNIQDNLDKIGNAKWFTAIDLLAGFHQIEMDEASAHKTAFQTPWGQYMYIRMPMGLKSAPSTFCRVVNAMLQGLPPGVAIDYIDDILITTDGDFSDHMRDVGMVFDRLIESGFTVKPKKCYIGFREVPYLGYLVGVNGVRLDPAKIQGLLSISFESVIEDPAHFVGIMQHYSRHIVNFAILAAPFYDLKRAKAADRARIVAADEAGAKLLRAAYTLLLDAVTNDDFLKRPDFTRPFILATDASALGAGAVLAQLDDEGHEHPIAYWSHLFNKDERGGSTTDREGRAVRDAVRHFRTYLVGMEFEVYTDHQALTWLMTNQHMENSVRQRWQNQLQDFTGMVIHHRPGKDMIVPDGISRLCSLIAMNKDADPRLRLSCHPSPSEDIDALLRPEPPSVEAAVFDSVTLGDVPDFVKPRSFMVTSDTPSSVDTLAAARAYETKVAQAAAALGLTPRPSLSWPDVAARQDVAKESSPAPPTDAVPALQPASAVQLAAKAPAPKANVGSANQRPTDAGVGVALVSGRQLLLWCNEGVARLPGGPVDIQHKTYRDHALLHYARLFGAHTPESLDAIRRAPYSSQCHNVKYFVNRLPDGYKVPVHTKADRWVDPVVGCLHPPPSGTSFWLDLDEAARCLQQEQKAGLRLMLSSAGVSFDPDVTMIHRLVIALLQLKDHSPHMHTLLTDIAPPMFNTSDAGTPSANSVELSTPPGEEPFPVDGPCYHDCRLTSTHALARIREVALQDPLHVIGVDLEGQLRIGGEIETVQVAAYLPDGSPVAHVFDIRADQTPLTSDGYAFGMCSLRTLLEDPQFVKVFHCGRGDLSILAHEYGILVERVYDTAIADSIIRGLKLGNTRGLRACVMEYAGVDMADKDSMDHSPHLWRARPMSKERFVYSYTDVLHLRAVYCAQSEALFEAKRVELAFDMSRSIAPPRVYPKGHGLYCRPDRVAFALHDGKKVIMMTLAAPLPWSDGNCRAVPSAKHDEAFYSRQLDNQMAAGRDLWRALVGKPVEGLAKLSSGIMKKPVRLGGTIVYEMATEKVDQSITRMVLHSFNLACTTAMMSKDARVVRPLMPAVGVEDVFMDPSRERGWTCLLFQYLLWITATRRPALMELEDSPVSVAKATVGDPSRAGGEEKGGGEEAASAAGETKPPSPASLAPETTSSEVLDNAALTHVSGEQIASASSSAAQVVEPPVAANSSNDVAFAAHMSSDPPTSIMVVVHDTLGVQGCNTPAQVITVSHKTRVVHLPEGLYDADRRAIDCALRALELQLGPVLCFHTAPTLSSALLRAANRATLLCRSGQAAAVISLSLDTPLSELRGELDAAFALRRETATLKALIPSFSVKELRHDLYEPNPVFALVCEALASSDTCFLSEDCTDACAKDLPRAGPGTCAQSSHVESSETTTDACAKDLALTRASVLVYHGDSVALGYRLADSAGMVSLAVVGCAHTLDEARATAVKLAESEFPGGLDVTWVGDTLAIAKAQRTSLSAPATGIQWCSIDDATEFAQVLEQHLLPALEAIRLRITPEAAFYTDYTESKEYDPSNPKPPAETALEREARLNSNHAFDYSSTPPSRSTMGVSSKPAIHEDDVIDSAGAPPASALPTLADIAAAQVVDKSFKHIYAHLKDPTAFRDADISEDTRANTIRASAQYRLINGCLYFMDLMASTTVPEYDQGGRPLLCVPKRFRTRLLELAHCASGHHGVRPTLRRLRELFYWPGMGSSTRAFVRRCHVCARAKRHQGHAGSAQRVEDGDRPWDVVTIDLYSYASIDGYDHVLVMADGFTRGVEAVACKGTPTSSQVVDIIRHRIIRGHRTTPRIIRSDHGSIFVSSVCQEFCDAFGIQLRCGSPEHHTTAGLAERFNRTVQEMLITHRLSSGDPRWYLYLGDLELCYNTKTHDEFDVSPTYLEYGRDGRLPWAVAFFGLEGLERASSGSAAEHVSHLHSVWDAHRVHLAAHALKVKRTRDLKLDTGFKLRVHDRVLLRRLPGHPKWQEPYHGPYRIAECLPHDNYALRDIDKSRLLAEHVHVDRLVYYPEITIHGDAAPQPDEFFVRRILKRRALDGGGYEYLVRFVGCGPDDDQWLPRSELGNCRELVVAFDQLLDGPSVDDPALVPSMADEPAEPLRPAGTFQRYASALVRPDPDRAETETPDAASEAPAPPPHGVDGQLPDGSYAIDQLLDVSRPGAKGRLNVLIQFHGLDPSTGLPWPPEWHPISRLGSAALRGEARLMEQNKYGSTDDSQPTLAAVPPLTTHIVEEYFGNSSDSSGSASARPHLPAPVMDALDVIRPWAIAYLDRLVIVPGASRHAEGPSSILRLRAGDHFMLLRDGLWVRVSSDSPTLTSAERRRCRSACAVTGLPDVAARI